MKQENSKPSLAQDLLRIHRVITRGLDISITRGEVFIHEGFPDATVLKGYTDYVQSLVTVLDAHHTTEDELAFPFFKEKIPDAPYSQLALEHEEMDQILVKSREILKGLDGEKGAQMLNLLVGLLRRLSAIWHRHIGVEEIHFDEAAINRIMEPEEQGRMSGMMAKHSMDMSTQPFLTVPFILYNLVPDDRAVLAGNMPPVIITQLVPVDWKVQWTPMKPFLLE
jgi:hemerythrin-like domain-containing protein